jgi:hypothetical protein
MQSLLSLKPAMASMIIAVAKSMKGASATMEIRAPWINAMGQMDVLTPLSKERFVTTAKFVRTRICVFLAFVLV